jgi:hypothetical protein
MITVYHIDYVKLNREDRVNLMFGSVSLAVKYAKAGLYYKVAEINTDSLDVAFHDTNHIDHDWTTNKSVKLLGPADGLDPDDVQGPSPSHRSTSVGDLMVKDGVTYMVSNFGFKTLEGVTLE